MTADDVELKHICYSPMVQTIEKVETDDCVIMSIFGYLQDNITKLNDEDYLNDLVNCVK